MPSSPSRSRALGAASAVVVLVLALGWWLLRGDEGGPRPPGVRTGGPTTPPSGPPSGVEPVRGSDPATPPATPDPHPGEHHDHPPGTEPVDPESPLAPDLLALRGRVQTADGRPVAGATVAAGQLTLGAQGWTLCQSDAAGRFQLSRRDVPASGLLEVGAAGFATRLVPVEPPGDAPRELVVVLLTRRALAGRVVAAEDGHPLQDAQVEGESASWRGWARTDAAGRFRLEDLPEGEEPNLFVRAEGRVGSVAAEPAQGELLISLERGVVVRGVVVGADGRPAEAAVWIVAAGQLVAPQVVKSDAAGRFEAWGVAQGDEVLVLAETRDAATPLTAAWQPPSEELRVELQPRASLTLRGARGGELALRAVDCPAPLPGAARVLGRGRTGGGGDLLLERLAAGRWQLEVDGAPRGEPIELAPGAALTVDVGALLAGQPAPAAAAEAETGPCEVAVRVVDELGRPLPHAEVGVMAGTRERTRQSGPDGLVRVGELPVGPITISAFLPGRVLVAPAYLEPTPGIPSEATLVLTPPAALQGRVLPPCPAEVRVLLPDGAPVGQTRCAADGTFRVGGLPRAKVRVEVEAPDCLPAAAEVELPQAGELTVTLQADPGHGDGPR